VKYEVYEVEFGLRPIASAFCSRWGGAKNVFYTVLNIDECHTYCIARGMSMDDVSELE